MKARLKLSFNADRLVLNRNGEFVGKGFCTLDAMVKIMNKNASASSFYITESIDLWHVRLGHVNIASMKRLKHLNLIPSFSKTEFSNVKYVLKQVCKETFLNH